MTAALESYGSGRIIRDGIRVALLGPPNVGKSSLLNALLGMRRAIVTDVPGTTRDYIEEQMLLQGEYFRFIDTAGVRDTDDSIEQEGIAIGRRVLQRADIVCVITDACDGLSASNEMMAQLKPENAEYEMFAVFNKSDLVSREVEEELNRHGVALSALHGQGIPTLTERLTELAHSMRSGSEKGRVLVTNARHADCLRRGIHALEAARRAGTEGMTEEFLAYEVRQAIEALGEIIGDVTTDDILNGIFSRFCIGK
jgi:tRNA modification GTPase